MKQFIVLMCASVVMVAASAHAVPVTIDEIVFQQDGSVNPAVLAGTADFSIVGGNLQIILTNVSTGATGGSAATNLLTGIGFNLPGGVTILNTGAINSIVATAGSSVFPPGSLTDFTWGAGNGPPALNNLTLQGDVNAVASTLQSFPDFDFAGQTLPPGNVNGPNFGLVSGSLPSSTCGGQACVQNSVTITLDLNSVPADLINFIDAGHVVLAFGSPNTRVVPEPATVMLLGPSLIAVGIWSRLRRARNSTH